MQKPLCYNHTSFRRLFDRLGLPLFARVPLLCAPQDAEKVREYVVLKRRDQETARKPESSHGGQSEGARI